MWVYDEQWTVETENHIRATYLEAGAPYDSARASVWNARCVSQAASGVMTRQKARWSTLNALRSQLGLATLPAPFWYGEEAGTLRVQGLELLNDNPRPGIGTLPWMVMGYRMFDAFGLHVYGQRDFRNSLDYPCELGFNTIFISTMMAQQNGHPVTLDPRVNTALYDKLTECAHIAFQRGVRLWVYACADAGALGISEPDQHRHWLRVCERLAGGYHVPSVANEGPNGNSSDQQRFPVPSGCPVWSRGSGGEFPPAPNGASLMEYEVKRRSAGEEPFKMTADCASVEYHNEEPTGPRHMRPMVQVENTFAASFMQLGRRSNQPRLFQAQAGCAMVTRGYGSGGYAFGSENSRMGQPLMGFEHECAEAAIRVMRTAW